MSYPTNNSDDVLNGFNPFESKEVGTNRATSSAPRPNFNQIVVPEPVKSDPTKGSNLQREMEERERALADMESKIQKREEELNKKEGSAKFAKMHNFPPLPQFCPCKPCFYQDCDVEIPDEYRGTVKLGFYIWLAYSILLFVNLFGTLSYMIISNTNNDTGAMFGVSLLMFFLMPTLGYVLWFRPLYRAFRSQSSINFFAYFLFFGILIIIVIIQVFGINVLGSCGWINSLIALKLHTGVSIFMIVIAIGFTVMVLLSVFLFIKVHRIYRTTGASFSKAKAEMRNETLSAALHA